MNGDLSTSVGNMPLSGEFLIGYGATGFKLKKDILSNSGNYQCFKFLPVLKKGDLVSSSFNWQILGLKLRSLTSGND